MSITSLESQFQSLKCANAAQHKQQDIVQLQIDEGIKMEDRFMCKDCLSNDKNQSKKVGMLFVLEIIKEKFQDFNSHKELIINLEQRYLSELREEFKNLNSELMKVLSQIDNWISMLTQQLEDLKTINQVNLIEEINLYIKQSCNTDLFDDFNKELELLKSSYQQKFQDNIQHIYQLTNQVFEKYSQKKSRNQNQEQLILESNIKRQSKIKVIGQQNQLNYITLTSISEINNQVSLSLAFDHQSTKLIAGLTQNLTQIRKIQDGVMSDKISKLHHQQQIYSIVYSKFQDWLAVGTEGGEVKTWKIQNSEWESSPPQNKHNKTVFCLLLNKNEDHLFSCSQDENIIIWNVNINENKISQHQFIAIKQGPIFSISLNSSEKYLAFCTRQDKIIIWENQTDNNEWSNKQVINLQENGYGFRLGFYREDFLIFQPQDQSICKVYQFQNTLFEERIDLQIQLESLEGKDKLGLSPIYYNHIKDVMIVKHDNCINFIRKQSDQKFVIVGIHNNQHYYFFQTMSQDGEYLAIQNHEQKLILYKVHFNE